MSPLALVAGTYTPFAIYLLEKNQAVILLSIVWGGAAFISHFIAAVLVIVR
jgi:predicted membrane channel-forming protein YqfA (hemolysin III family)